MNPVLRAQNLKKRFPAPSPLEILKGVDVTLFPKKSLAITGKSGEGKTTLLHILGTIEAATSGSLEICGQKVTAGRANQIRNKHIGFIFQAFHLIGDLSALDNVLMPVAISRRSIGKGSPAYKEALELLDMVGLSARAHFHAHKLSGGERQRVAIARAFINNPDIILADEPTGSLDHETARAVTELLITAVREKEKALLVVTHNVTLAKLAEDCYELEDGVLHHANENSRNP